MQCPFCSAPDTRVVDSRLAAEGFQVRRRRECASCNERFTTFETAELVMPMVRKRHGECEPFNELKLRSGINHALYKRSVRPEDIEAAVAKIMHRLRTLGEREVQAGTIGDWVMEELRDLDQVAFVRFASVYRRFEDVNEFRKAIDRLETEPSADLKKLQLDLIDPKPS